MKRLLLILVLFIGMSNINAQCIPDPQYTDPGIYPDTATGLSDAMVGQAYSELITAITPLDTNIVYSGIPLLVTIDYIALTGVTGLPPNFAYDCDPIDCSFPGGSAGCAEIYSTSNPVAAAPPISSARSPGAVVTHTKFAPDSTNPVITGVWSAPGITAASPS